MGMRSYEMGIIAGMQLSQRICRNRATDCDTLAKETLESRYDDRKQEALVCMSVIRSVQVEIGSGRMPRPEFTIEEQDAINRIS